MPFRIAIDTNLLILVLADVRLRQQRTFGTPRLKLLTDERGRDDALPPERFDDLWQVFESAERRIVTQHVMIEALRGRKDSPLSKKENLWEAAVKLLEDYQLEEQSCVVSELFRSEDYKKILQDIGPTDAGLIFVAAREKVTLISDDENLLRWARVRRVPCFSLRHLDQFR